MDPTLPFSNRVLKRLSANNNAWVTVCEDRSRPEQSVFLCLFFFFLMTKSLEIYNEPGSYRYLHANYRLQNYFRLCDVMWDNQMIIPDIVFPLSSWFLSPDGTTSFPVEKFGKDWKSSFLELSPAENVQVALYSAYQRLAAIDQSNIFLLDRNMGNILVDRDAESQKIQVRQCDLEGLVDLKTGQLLADPDGDHIGYFLLHWPYVLKNPEHAIVQDSYNKLKHVANHPQKARMFSTKLRQEPYLGADWQLLIRQLHIISLTVRSFPPQELLFFLEDLAESFQFD